MICALAFCLVNVCLSFLLLCYGCIPHMIPKMFFETVCLSVCRMFFPDLANIPYSVTNFFITLSVVGVETMHYYVVCIIVTHCHDCFVRWKELTWTDAVAVYWELYWSPGVCQPCWTSQPWLVNVKFSYSFILNISSVHMLLACPVDIALSKCYHPF